MPLVWLFVGITFIVAYPIAKVLDWASAARCQLFIPKMSSKA